MTSALLVPIGNTASIGFTTTPLPPMSPRLFVPPDDFEAPTMPTPKRGQAARIERVIAKHFPNVRPSELPTLREQLAKNLAIADRYHGDPCGLKACPLIQARCACMDRVLQERCPCCRQDPFRPCVCFPRFEPCRHILELRADFADFDEEMWPWSLEEFADLARIYLDGYDEPQAPPTPTERVTKDQELDRFEKRAGVKYAGGPSQFGLRHPHDILPADRDAIGTQAGKGLVRLDVKLTKDQK